MDEIRPEEPVKVLYFTQFYTPESIAASFRATENSKIWATEGHDITVFTGYPNYPKGKIFDGYVPKLLSKEIINDVKVIRSKLVAKPNTSMIRRIENAFSFFAFGLINIVFNIKKIGKRYDVVIGTSGVVFNALLARIYAGLYKIPFVFELRDITYIQLQATGKSKNSYSVKLMKWLELYLCRKAKKVVVVTNGFKEKLIEEGVLESKIEVITNGVDVNESFGVYADNKNFILGYFGTLGISQNIIETFEYAKQINDLVTEFQYMIIGEGAQKAEIETGAKDISFVKVLSGMSYEELEAYYCDTQMSVITLVKSNSFKYTIPSKLFQIMGRGIAVLFIGPNGEAAEIIRKNHAGIALTGSKEEDLVILREFFADSNWKNRLKEMGMNGRKTVERQYSRKKLAEEYIEILRDASKGNV